MGGSRQSLILPFQGILDAYIFERSDLLPRSKVEYETTIGQFLAFLQSRGVYDLREVGKGSVEEYLTHLESQDWSQATRRTKTMIVRSFFTWLKEAGFVAADPAQAVEPPARDDKLPRILTEDEIKRLMTIVKEPRDRAIVMLLLHTGIKLGEIARLTLADVMVPKRVSQGAWGTMRVLGTGRKETRVLLLNREVCEALANWLRKRSQNASSDALFLSGRGNPLSQSQYQKLMKKYFKAAWIKDASVHTLRHTFAIRQLEMGTDVETLKELLGLKEKDTIRLYVELVQNQQVEQRIKH